MEGWDEQYPAPLFVSSARISYSHPHLLLNQPRTSTVLFQITPFLNNKRHVIHLYKDTLATAIGLQVLTQHIWGPHGNVNGDQRLANNSVPWKDIWTTFYCWKLWDNFGTIWWLFNDCWLSVPLPWAAGCHFYITKWKFHCDIVN